MVVLSRYRFIFEFYAKSIHSFRKGVIFIIKFGGGGGVNSSGNAGDPMLGVAA